MEWSSIAVIHHSNYLTVFDDVGCLRLTLTFSGGIYVGSCLSTVDLLTWGLYLTLLNFSRISHRRKDWLMIQNLSHCV
jgi:hypothetical protein